VTDFEAAQDRYWKRNGPVTNWKNDVGPGWHPLLDQLHAELSELVPDYKTAQVKEKFGKLRVYVDLPAAARETLGDAIWQVLGKYEDMSGHTCEDCGQPGEVRTSRHWLRTLCDECEARRHVAR
jgi:hypothetical protein